MSVGDAPVVLLEGRSDIAAVRAAADVAEVDLSDVRLVDLGGITNIRSHLVALTHEACGGEGPDAEHVLGMCDVGETRFVESALESTGHWVRDASDLPSAGFFVCVEDLEDELLRALGIPRVLGVLDRLGLRGKLDALAQQPAWRDRPLHEQLHRFAGVASGRKELLAAELTAELTPDELPEPLRLLLDRLR
ncbi:hypothetical protein [Nostocoides sp. F2B08]|uniref:hypothetical protein n=1 Tax=Nostocoides sp. F2B08 TaxID=2653936 RepID=UPI001D0432D5|nr:hypothetical protein [Tetrasphaera sp. F2B08]